MRWRWLIRLVAMVAVAGVATVAAAVAPTAAVAVTTSTVVSAPAMLAGRQRLTHLPILMDVLPHASASTSETRGAAPDNRNRLRNFRYLACRSGVS